MLPFDEQVEKLPVTSAKKMLVEKRMMNLINNLILIVLALFAISGCVTNRSNELAVVGDNPYNDASFIRYERRWRLN